MSSYINTEWANTIAEEIDAIPDCRALQELIKKLEKMIQKQLDELIAQAEALLELVIPPTNLAKLIKWAKKQAAYYYGQYLRVIQTIAELTAAYQKILTAIQNKLENLKCNVSISPPSITIPTLPDIGAEVANAVTAATNASNWRPTKIDSNTPAVPWTPGT